MTIPPTWRIERQGTEATLRVAGDWVAPETGLRDSAAVRQVLADCGTSTRLILIGTELGRWDSALVAFVLALRTAAAAQGIQLDESGLPDAARRLLALAAEGSSETATVTPSRTTFLARIGNRTIAQWRAGVGIADLIGQMVLRTPALFTGRSWSRAQDVLQLMRESGAAALGIVAIVNGMIGGILAFVGAVQLRRFGTQIYVADLVGIATAREMAAVMTAIVLAGRTGGAYAAQIATMQGNEEIDALKALGIPVFDYLVLPRVTALVTMMPLLYLYACAIGLLGGLIVGVAVLDITPLAYLQETRRAVSPTQFVIGITKSLAFGALIALASCHIGLRAGRSAADVGRAATSAVVAGIIGVIAIDAVFALCANALKI
jgi:phospholipid/cholesterol/gamma-HCH transport system permease protein